jgi:hypothetical protein
MALGDIAVFDVQSLTTLSAAGVTSSIELYAHSVTFQVTVSSIGTNVVIRFEASLDDTSYFNLDQSGTDTTITANGTYGFALSGCPVRYIRLRLVSLSGGTPSVACKAGAL